MSPLKVGMRRVNLATFVLHTHDMRVLAVNSCMSLSRAMAAESNAVAVVDSMSDLTAPHTLFGVVSALFSAAISEGGADLLDPRSGERRSDVKGRVDMTLNASKGVGLSEAGRTPVKSLALDFQRLTELSHTFGETIARLLVGSKVLDFSSERRVVLIK